MTQRPLLQRISIVSNRKHPAVVAGFVPASPDVEAKSKNNRGGRDKPGHDREGEAKRFS
jgi:hypothetical protein